MSAQQAISAFVGAALSILLQTVPHLKQWWADQRGKVLILLTLHVGGAVGLWLVACKLGISTGLPIACNLQGLANLGWTGTMGFVGNQATYGLTEYAVPTVKSRLQAMRLHAHAQSKSSGAISLPEPRTGPTVIFRRDL